MSRSDDGNQRQRQRRQVLPEEEYTSTLSAIVQRDYFPALPELQRQAAVLQCRSQGDVTGAVAVRRAARKIANHQEALASIEANEETDLVEYNGDGDGSSSSFAAIRRNPRPLHQESITGFHARVTNEDDDEFDKNQKQEIKANRERLESLFHNNDDTSKTRPLMLTSDSHDHMASDNFAPESNRILASEWNKPNVRNPLFLPPTPLIHGSTTSGQAGTQNETIKLITNNNNQQLPASKNELALQEEMPPPARISVPKTALVEYVPKHKLEKKIEPSQTRFPESSSRIIPLPNRSLLPSSANDSSEIDDNTDYGSITDASTDLDAPMRSIESERRRRQKVDDRNQLSYVAMTPLVVPGGNTSPITTWGTIDSTPVILSGQQHDEDETETNTNTTAKTMGSTFVLSGENEREKAARKAESELARRAKRAKTPNIFSSSTVKKSSSASSSKKLYTSSLRASSSLTPAARSLLDRTTRNRKAASSSTILSVSRSRDAFGSALRSSYTPKLSTRSSSSRPSSSRRRLSDNAHKATPLVSRTQR